METSELTEVPSLVPGCGRGYDVLLLASHGYDAVGLDISESAIKECKKFADEEAPKYLDNAKDAGSYQFVTGDFFKDDWLETVGADESRFHFIYDYTVSITCLSSVIHTCNTGRTVFTLMRGLPFRYGGARYSHRDSTGSED